MAEMEFAADDRIRETPKWVLDMSREERDSMIAKLEAEARREKERILQEQAKRA